MSGNGRPGVDEWLRGSGPDEDIVVSTRVRLARNVEGFSFSSHQTADEARILTETVKKSLGPAMQKLGWRWIDLDELGALERLVLVERHVISRELEAMERSRAVMHDDEASASLMVNEEDHLRLQVFRSGLRMEEAWEAADLIDDSLATALPFAYSNKFGFLTSCPTNTGTGLRISVMLHLPALVAAKEIEKATTAIQEMNMTARGLYGEGSRAVGDLFQVSNQRTLGESEDEILSGLQQAVTSLINWERKQREEFLQSPIFLEDRAWRGLGTLERARSLCSEEAIDLLSRVKLGRVLGLLEEPSMDVLTTIFLLSQPGHLQSRVGRELSPEERDIVRARLVRDLLA